MPATLNLQLSTVELPIEPLNSPRLPMVAETDERGRRTDFANLLRSRVDTTLSTEPPGGEYLPPAGNALPLPTVQVDLVLDERQPSTGKVAATLAVDASPESQHAVGDTFGRDQQPEIPAPPQGLGERLTLNDAVPAAVPLREALPVAATNRVALELAANSRNTESANRTTVPASPEIAVRTAEIAVVSGDDKPVPAPVAAFLQRYEQKLTPVFTDSQGNGQKPTPVVTDSQGNGQKPAPTFAELPPGPGDGKIPTEPAKHPVVGYAQSLLPVVDRLAESAPLAMPNARPPATVGGQPTLQTPFPDISALASTAQSFAADLETTSIAIDTPVRDAAWGERLAERVLMLAGNQLKGAEIRLTPAELGPLRVQIRIEEGTASVAFQSQHAVTREAIEQALPRLRELLAETGLGLGQTDVSERDFGNGQSEQRGAADARRAASDGDEGWLPDDERQRATTSRVVNALVDTFA